jgi:NAD(P)-dependent dehydrogenase (short-subunit alcohol dehydrogenase family)
MQQRTVLITGASRGIGRATAERLAKKGYKVIGIARKKGEGRFPGEFFPCDLTDRKTTEDIIRQIPFVDVLINNVATVHPQSLEEVELEKLDEVYELNVRVSVQLAKAFVGHMKKQKWGRIINITSRAFYGAPNRTSYGAAKGALVGLTHNWAIELAPFGITVNAISPTGTETDMLKEAYPHGNPGREWLLSKIPLGRFGQPDEIAAGVEFLISEEAGFITRQIFSIDGGASH